jgi:hypothetical protein
MQNNLHMKKITTAVAFLALSYFASAQAVETQADINKTKQAAGMVEYVIDAGMAEDILAEDLKSKGFGKGKSTKGFKVYQGINFNEISADKIDLYIKAEKKSKKEKDKTIITMLVSKGYDNFVNATNDPKAMTAVLTYLNNLKPKLDLGNLDALIAEQQEVFNKAEKKQGNYVDDLNDLEKKKRNIEDDITKKKADIEAQKAEVEKQRLALEALKLKRKG